MTRRARRDKGSILNANGWIDVVLCNRILNELFMQLLDDFAKAIPEVAPNIWTTGLDRENGTEC